jgi:hypothetical protein
VLPSRFIKPTVRYDDHRSRGCGQGLHSFCVCTSTCRHYSKSALKADHSTLFKGGHVALDRMFKSPSCYLLHICRASSVLRHAWVVLIRAPAASQHPTSFILMAALRCTDANCCLQEMLITLSEEHRLKQATALLLMRMACNL